jgi:kynurenine formamidase
MTLLGSDTAGTDPIPTVDLSKTVHAALLVERGIHLVENLVLDELAASGRRRGVFVCLPLRLVGATGSWVRPVAIA